MRLKPILLAAGVVIFISVLAYELTVQETLRKVRRAPMEQRANVLQLTGAVIQKHVDGRLQWELWAQHAAYLEEEQESEMDGVHFKIYRYSEDVADASIISGSALRARLVNRTKTLILEGEVHLTEDSQTEMRGERMVYDHAENTLSASGPVWVRNRRTYHEGRDLRYAISEQRITLAAPTLYQ